MPTALALLTFALAAATVPSTDTASDAHDPAAQPPSASDAAPRPKARSAFGAAIAEMTRALQATPAPATPAAPAPRPSPAEHASAAGDG